MHCKRFLKGDASAVEVGVDSRRLVCIIQGIYRSSEFAVVGYVVEVGLDYQGLVCITGHF